MAEVAYRCTNPALAELDNVLNILFSGKDGLALLREERRRRMVDDVVRLLKTDSVGDNALIIRARLQGVGHNEVFGLMRSAARLMEDNAGDLLLRKVFPVHVTRTWFAALEAKHDKKTIRDCGKRLRDAFHGGENIWLVGFFADLLDAACIQARCYLVRESTGAQATA